MYVLFCCSRLELRGSSLTALQDCTGHQAVCAKAYRPSGSRSMDSFRCALDLWCPERVDWEITDTRSGGWVRYAVDGFQEATPGYRCSSYDAPKKMFHGVAGPFGLLALVNGY